MTTTYTILHHGQSYGGFGSMTEATLVALTLWPCGTWTIALEAGR